MFKSESMYKIWLSDDNSWLKFIPILMQIARLVQMLLCENRFVRSAVNHVMFPCCVRGA